LSFLRNPRFLLYILPLFFPFFAFFSYGKDVRIWIHFSSLPSLLIRLIDRAVQSIDGAFYRIEDPNVAEALKNAKKKGVNVRLVIDKEGISSQAVTELIDAGIKVVSNEGEAGLMHNKFLLVDGRYVWTGSYNPILQGPQNDNALLIDSPPLAKRYVDEFNELFSGIFGGGEKTKDRKVYVGEVKIEVYFAPEDNVKRRILSEIRKAQRSIHFAYFSFSDEDYSEEIIERLRDGVIVEGVVDDTASGGEEAVRRMYDAGVGVVYSHPLGSTMHHKFIIIDMERVITGSFNLSVAANERNDENILIIQSHEVASIYYAEFKSLYTRSSKAEEGKDVIHYVYAKPNPATTHTIITYSLGLYPDAVKINVFDVAGDLVKEIDEVPSSPGHNEYLWNLTNNEGFSLSPGIYIIQVKAGVNGRTVSGFTKLAILRE
jgi:phosphatidylserine/phosphatidylglycerophosphate/cardiolipin synthase-like enzyme